MNFFYLSLRLAGFDIVKARKVMADLNAMNPVEFTTYQDQQRRAIVEFHLKHNPFYRKLADVMDFNSWEELPILTKGDLQQPISERLSRGVSKEHVFTGRTSGSSGQPFVFAKDNWSHALTWAGFDRAYRSRDIDLFKGLQARFYGVPHTWADRFKERLKDGLSGRYRFSISDLSAPRLDGFVKKFKHTSFTSMNGYTSSILLFAKYLLEKKIVLHQLCPSLICCIVTSEMLFEQDRAHMERAFGVPVVNEYGASEMGLIAFEDEFGELVVDQKLLYVEVLDDRDGVLPYGEKGRLVLTSLHNKAHPFIRYEIGDLGILEPSKKTGNLIIKQLSGRISDIARLPSGKVVPGLAFYHVTKSVMEASGNVKEFIVTQTKPDSFRINYVSDRPLNPKETEHLTQTIEEYLEPGLRISIDRLEHLDRGQRGKLKQFTSLL